MNRGIINNAGANNVRPSWTRRVSRAVFLAFVTLSLALAVGCGDDGDDDNKNKVDENPPISNPGDGGGSGTKPSGVYGTVMEAIGMGNGYYFEGEDIYTASYCNGTWYVTKSSTFEETDIRLGDDGKVRMYLSSGEYSGGGAFPKRDEPVNKTDKNPCL